MKTITNMIYPAIALFAFACFALPPAAHAVSPASDGGYPGGNTAEGQKALLSLTTGTNNTAVGWFSLRAVMDGQLNTAIGAATLFANTGNLNTATGGAALFSNTIGSDNTASGALALFHNTIASDNTAVGAYALFDNDSTGNGNGGGNSAFGVDALRNNTDGSYNTAVGNGALVYNQTGNYNVGVGVGALVNNLTGDLNAAIGYLALGDNTAGSGNTAVGDSALSFNTADRNTAVGAGALLFNTTGSGNIAVGENALRTNDSGGNNTAIGGGTGSNQTTGSNNVYIGAGINGLAGESDTCRIKSIFGQTAANGSAVFITSGNKLGTDTSSKRFKEDIKPMDQASEALMALKPVTFRYKKEIDRDSKSQFGLVAEDVEKVNPDLVVRDKEGKPYSVRYDQVNAMLLNEFLKEHKKVDEQQANISELNTRLARQDAIIAQQQKGFQSKLTKQEKQMEALTLGLQKVSAQLATASPSAGGLEVNRPRPQVVVNGP